jgi:hypothetical protein
VRQLGGKVLALVALLFAFRSPCLLCHDSHLRAFTWWWELAEYEGYFLSGQSA